MWRFCGRDQLKFSNTNPVGVSKFSVIYANWRKLPEIELFGKNKIELKKADVKKVESAFPEYDVVGISAKTGKNIEKFYETLFKLIR